MTTTAPSTIATPVAIAVPTSISANPSITSAQTTTPTITIASSGTTNQTVTTFSINNFGSNLYGVQVGVTNLPASSAFTLASNVSGWTPSTSTQSQAISTVALDTTLSNPLPSPISTTIETLTINQGNISTPLVLSNFTLTAKNTNGTFTDLNLVNQGYNVNITGSVGFTVPASNVSDTYTGGTGLNTLVFSDVYSKYAITALGNSNFSVTYSTNGSVDSVQSFQRLKFKDVGIAFDLNGSAGQVAKILGAIYGKSIGQIVRQLRGSGSRRMRRRSTNIDWRAVRSIILAAFKSKTIGHKWHFVSDRNA
jgi:hypothetical protein